MLSKLTGRWPMLTAIFLALLQLWAAAVFLAVAVIVHDWRPAVLTVVGLIGAGWNARTALRILAARRRGAVSLPHALGGASARGQSSEAYEARLRRGSQVRRGILFVVEDVSAFVPTEAWVGQRSGVLLSAARAWLSHVTVAQIPVDAVQLLHNVEVQGGVVVGRGWEWTPGRDALVDSRSGDQLTVSMPTSAKLRWPPKRITRSERLRARRIARLAVAAGGGVGAFFTAAGAVAWALTDDVDYFVAGLAWGGLVVLGPTVALIVAYKQYRIDPAGS